MICSEVNVHRMTVSTMQLLFLLKAIALQGMIAQRLLESPQTLCTSDRLHAHDTMSGEFVVQQAVSHSLILLLLT